MIMYWLMFLIPSIATVGPHAIKQSQSRLIFWLVCFAFALVLGLRDQIGGDWLPYNTRFFAIGERPLLESFSRTEPGYVIVNWFVYQMGGSIHWVNLSVSLLLMYGVGVFCQQQPRKWLSLLVAVPYLIIVVGMGYTRQAAALGCIMLAYVAIARGGRSVGAVGWVALGTMFHVSAMIILPLAAVVRQRNRWLNYFAVAFALFSLYVILLQDQSEALWQNYVEAQLQSQGAAIRIAMNALPAAMLILFSRRLGFESEEQRLWILLSVAAMLCIPMLSVSSTVVDRLALYLIPLQLVVYSRVDRIMGEKPFRSAIVLLVVLGYASIQFVWLNYSPYKPYWVPYRSVLSSS